MPYLESYPKGGRAAGTLILVHAFPLTARMWEPQLGLSDLGWHVVAPHLRGFGDDTSPPAATMDDFAGELIHLFQQLQIRQAVVAGLSLGGYVAFALLRRAPQYFRGLVLADTRAEADTPEAREGRSKMLALLREQGPAAVAGQMIPKLLGEQSRRDRPDLEARVRELVLSNTSEAIAGAIAAMMTRPDSTDLLGRVPCPSLVVVGEHDTLTPPAVAERLEQGIPGARRRVIPGAGHLPNLEQPDAFNAAVADFLGDLRS